MFRYLRRTISTESRHVRSDPFTNSQITLVLFRTRAPTFCSAPLCSPRVRLRKSTSVTLPRSVIEKPPITLMGRTTDAIVAMLLSLRVQVNGNHSRVHASTSSSEGGTQDEQGRSRLGQLEISRDEVLSAMRRQLRR